MDEENKYISYNMLARNPLTYGVPFMLGLVMLFLIVASVFLAIIVGYKFLWLIPFTLLFLLVAIKLVSENDSRAVEKLSWKIRALFFRLKFGGILLNVSPQLTSKTKQREKINDFFKVHADRSDRSKI